MTHDQPRLAGADEGTVMHATLELGPREAGGPEHTCNTNECESSAMVTPHPPSRSSPRNLALLGAHSKSLFLTKKIHLASIVLFVISLALFFAERNSNSRRNAVGRIVLETGQKDYDWAHDLALTEMKQNVRDNRFIAGEGWTQLWTRDTSYAAEQAAALLYPSVVRSSLEASVETDKDGAGIVWLQDSCDHFGGWPVLSDAIVGARGAWSAYRSDGNHTFLAWAYDVTKNSLVRAERDAFDEKMGLFTGCSSFMESNSGYPAKYKGRGDLVGKTRALSTNALYYSGYSIAAAMGKELRRKKAEIEEYTTKAAKLRDAISSRLWLNEEGYFSYVMDENDKLMTNFEGLGESLVLLDDIESDDKRIQSIFTNVKQDKYGLPSLWPQFDLEASKFIEEYYHNGRQWPFVHGYYAMAAAKYGQVDVFAHSIQALKDLAVKSKTFAEFYELNGSFPVERSRQLWSETGYLAMVYQGLFGISYAVDGLRFAPIKPASIFPSDVSLKNFKYRNMILDITVKGTGSQVKSFHVDGKKRRAGKRNGTPYLSSKVKGRHKVMIVVGDK